MKYFYFKYKIDALEPLRYIAILIVTMIIYLFFYDMIPFWNSYFFLLFSLLSISSLLFYLTRNILNVHIRLNIASDGVTVLRKCILLTKIQSFKYSEIDSIVVHEHEMKLNVTIKSREKKFSFSHDLQIGEKANYDLIKEFQRHIKQYYNIEISAGRNTTSKNHLLLNLFLTILYAFSWYLLICKSNQIEIYIYVWLVAFTFYISLKIYYFFKSKYHHMST